MKFGRKELRWFLFGFLALFACEEKDFNSDAKRYRPPNSDKPAVKPTIPNLDKDSSDQLKAGFVKLAQPDQRHVEVDLSSRISQVDARKIFNGFAEKYGPRYDCLFYREKEFYHRGKLKQRLQSLETIVDAFVKGRASGSFSIVLEDMKPFLKEVQAWQNLLAESRPELNIVPSRSCFILTTKEKEISENWHTDNLGKLTVIWTVYGKRTLYSLKSDDPPQKEDIRSPKYGHILAFKDRDNIDQVEPILHASPGKKQDRLTFVTFFNMSRPVY